MFTQGNKNIFAENPNEILIRCLRKDDFTEWDEWRHNHKREPISLKGTRLSNANLAGADLSQVDLKAADLRDVNLTGADLSETNLAGADLRHANLSSADLWKADLKFARLWEANLKNAKLEKTNLENAELLRINLEGADLWKANLNGAKLVSVFADRHTFIWGCDFDEQTVFSGGGFSQARIDPRLIQRINKNIGRLKL